MNNPNPHIWGKTLRLDKNNDQAGDVYYPLIGHMLDTATVAGILWDNWLRRGLKEIISTHLGSKVKNFIQLAAGLHDLGKCSPIFQGQMVAQEQRRRPDVQSLLESEGFEFPNIKDSKAYRLKKLHRHEKIGLYSLTQTTTRTRELATDCWLEMVLLGHHGSYDLSYGNRRNPHEPLLQALLTKTWIEEQKTLLLSVEAAVNVTTIDALNKTDMPHEVIILISGLIILADRIASNDDSVNDAYHKLQNSELSTEKPAEWLTTRVDFLESITKREVGFSSDLDYSDILGSYSPRGIQNNYPKERGLWLCMAPTGAGKTEAALLRHHEHKERLTLLLPTLSTTNAMMGRLTKTFENKDITTAVLGHSLAYLEDFYNNRNLDEIDREDKDDCGLTPTKFSGVNGAKLSAAVNIATIDQLLMGAFPIKWTPLRWVLLANTHVIIDEAHLLDHYQVELLAPILHFLGKTDTRVSILSATLPNWLENNFSKNYSNGKSNKAEKTIFPSSVLVDTDFNRSIDTNIDVESYSATVKVEKSTDSVKDHITWAQNALLKYPEARLGVFVNQVKRAQSIAYELQKTLPKDVEVICLHSRMLAKHRKQVTDKLLKDLKTGSGTGKRVILVGTQVIEMSLDIDLDLISTDLCPAPSLIQRMGRAWRDKSSTKRFERIDAELNSQMSVRIAIPVDREGKLKDKELLPYKESVLIRTARFLGSKSELSFPQDLQDFVETVMVNSESIESKGEENEFADSIYKTMRGKDVAINSKFLSSDPIYNTLSMQQYGPLLTDSSLISEDIATRLVEGPQGEPFILSSNDSKLQDLGALSPNVELSKIGTKRAQQASVGLSMRMSSLLDKDETIEKLEIKDLRKWGYFGELPSYLKYDYLVGLMEE